jgi:hypothetical protein
MGGEVGDGLYAQGRGVRHPKGSQEAKDHMAKLRAMKGKGMKQSKPAKPEIERDPRDAEIARQRFLKEPDAKAKYHAEIKAQKEAEKEAEEEKKHRQRAKDSIALASGEEFDAFANKYPQMSMLEPEKPEKKPEKKPKKKKGKGLKGGAMPPPSRSPVTNEVIAGGLYA